MTDQARTEFDGDQDYERFKEAVPHSWKAVWSLAKYLQANGRTVQLPPMSLCGSYAERNNGFGDDYDISVMTHYEVKWHDFDFTCAADYPYSNVIVDRAVKVEKVGTIIGAYWQLNKPLSHALVIPQSTRPKWFKKTVKDSVKGFEFEVFMCAKEFAIFKPLNQKAGA